MEKPITYPDKHKAKHSHRNTHVIVLFMFDRSSSISAPHIVSHTKVRIITIFAVKGETVQLIASFFVYLFKAWFYAFLCLVLYSVLFFLKFTFEYTDS